MKFFLCIFAATLLAGALADVTQERRQRLNKFSKECQAVSGVSDETIQKARRGEAVDDPKLKDQAICVAKKIGVINEAGEVQVEVIRRIVRSQVADQEEADKLVTKCTVAEANTKVTALHVHRCLLKAKPDIIVSN